MYPRGELKRLAARKALLQARITLRRLECQLHAERIAQPLRAVDRLWARWRQIAPLVQMVGMPVALWGVTKWLRRGGAGGKWAGWLKYAPVALRAVRMLAQARGRAGESTHAAAPGASG